MRRHTVACLAGDGLGPELMAEATRTLRKVARMHGFAIEEVHVPFGSEALTRSGHPLPPATRSAVLAADAVLVATGGSSPAAGSRETARRCSPRDRPNRTSTRATASPTPRRCCSRRR